MKTASRLLAIFIIAALTLSLGGAAFASGEASGGASGASGEMASAVSVTGNSVETDDTYFTGTATENAVSDFEISSDSKQLVGLAISGDGDEKITVKNGTISMQELGTAISIYGGAQAEIDGVVVWNTGRADGVSAAGQSNTLVKTPSSTASRTPSPIAGLHRLHWVWRAPAA